MVALAYTNIFTADIDRLAEFYSALFGFKEIVESRSPIFRGFTTGSASLGFSGTGAFDLLGLAPQEGPGDRVMQTFNVENKEEVDAYSAKAVELGASIVKEPFETYYGWYQSVLRDPDGNCFRVNFPGAPA